MTVGEIAAICGIPSALTVGIVGFLFWLLEHRIAKKEAERVAQISIHALRGEGDSKNV